MAKQTEHGDKERIDFLERFVNEHGSIMLHDGRANTHGVCGLGLRPGYLIRTLREAIDTCMGVRPIKRQSKRAAGRLLDGQEHK